MKFIFKILKKFSGDLQHFWCTFSKLQLFKFLKIKLSNFQNYKLSKIGKCRNSNLQEFTASKVQVSHSKVQNFKLVKFHNFKSSKRKIQSQIQSSKRKIQFRKFRLSDMKTIFPRRFLYFLYFLKYFGIKYGLRGSRF